MTEKKPHSVFAKTSVLGLKKQMENNPLAFKTVSQLWDTRPGESRSSTEKAFKSLTGYRIKEYLVLMRLEHSKQFLKEGIPVKRVAKLCSYDSQSAYCTAFKRFFKQSPRDWLNEEQQ